MSEKITIQNPIVLDMLSNSNEFQNIPLEDYVKIANIMKTLGIKNYKPINITRGCKTPKDIIKLIQIISKNLNYEFLNLKLCNVTNNVINELAKNPKLNGLILNKSLIKNNEAQNVEILNNLSNLKNLRYLNLENNFQTYKNPLTFDFSKFLNLSKIDLSNNYINIETIENLVKVKNLIYLNLENSKIITIVGKSIEYPFIGDILIDYIYKMKNLEYLNLNHIIADEIYGEDVEEIQNVLDELKENLKKLKCAKLDILPTDKRLIKFEIDPNVQIFNY